MTQPLTLPHQRRRRRIGTILVVLSLLLLGGGAAALFSYGTVEVTLTRAEVQRRIDERLPFSGQRGPIQYQVEATTIDLRPNGRIAADTTFKANAGRRDASGRIIGSGVIEYQEGAFYLRQLEIEDTAFEVSQPRPSPSSEVAAAVRNLATSALARAGLDDETTALMAASRDYFSTRAKEALIVGLRNGLQTHPVYRLKDTDTRHSLAKLLLSEVKVRDGQLVIILDPLQALTRVLIKAAIFVGAFILAIGFLFALTTRNGGGATLGILTFPAN